MLQTIVGIWKKKENPLLWFVDSWNASKALFIHLRPHSDKEGKLNEIHITQLMMTAHHKFKLSTHDTGEYCSI
jgi:hypothetical protein